MSSRKKQNSTNYRGDKMKPTLVDLDRETLKTPISPIPVTSVPLSYLPIELSTNGRLGVPKVVYCRNFNTEDILTLSMLAENILPERVIAVLNSLMYGDVDVASWPEKTIIELLVQIYANYFTPVLFEVRFPWNESDITWLEEKGDIKKVEQLQKGLWIPRIDLDLRTCVTINSLNENVKETVTITKKDKEGKVLLKAKFISYPKYGDVLIIRKEVQNKFQESDKKYSKIQRLSETYSTYIDQDRDISTLPNLDTMEYLEWQNAELQKNIYLADATLALYLLEFNGEDVSGLPLSEKVQILKRPEFDVNISAKINKHYNSLKFGIDPEIHVKNPITGENCTRRYSFRPYDIIQAIQSREPDGYDLSYDE
jgi:hypothetical protein